LKQDEVALEREMAAVRTMDGGLKGLVGCEDRLSTAKASLAALGMAPGDPRTLYAVADKEAKRRPDLEKKKDREQAEIDRLVKELQRLDQDLSPYAGLDDRIREQEALQRSHRQGHQVFIANEQLASQLDRRKSEDQQARLALEKAVGSLGAAVDEHRDAAASYDAAAHERCILELDDLKKQQTMASTRKQEKEIQDAREARRLEELTVKAAELAEKRAEQARREGLSDAAEMVRKCIKAAGPKVTEQLVGEISRAAERIFNELIGDHSVGLKWTDDYEIRLINDGRERTLWPAAGSERVTAALAVRLALLECMSEIRFAFFDEPTIHLDETRRSALVDQLLGLNNFDQIFVISHDDSFERATDHMVRLTKVNGRTEVAQV
jgi:exonuclease SbcC